MSIANEDPLLDWQPPSTDGAVRFPAIAQIMKLWRLDEPSVRDEEFQGELTRRLHKVAISSFINCAGTATPRLLVGRQELMKTAFGDGCRLLPVIPVLGTRGALAIDTTESCVHYLPWTSFENSDSEHVSVNDSDGIATRAPEEVSIRSLKWNQKNDGTFPMAVAPLNGYEYLNLEAEELKANLHQLRGSSALPGWIARSFRKLAEFVRSDSNNPDTHHAASRDSLVPVACAMSLVATERLAGHLPDASAIISVRVPSEEIRGQAFIRIGPASVEPSAVPKVDDDLWRIGVAIADFLNLLDESRGTGRLRPAPIRASDEWYASSLINHSLYRLRGGSLSRHYRPSPLGSSLPELVDSVLKRLEYFSDVAATESSEARFALALSTWIQRRASSLWHDSSIAILRTGDLLTLVSDAPWSDDRQLADELPSLTISGAIASLRRPVSAWIALADRLQQLLTLSPSANNQNELQAVIGGLRLRATITQIRCLTLDIWGQLREETRRSFELNTPNAVDWDLAEDSPLCDGVREDESNQNALFRILNRAVDGHAASHALVQRIHPLGWTVALGSMLGALDRPEPAVPAIVELLAPNDHGGFGEVISVLKNLARALSEILPPSSDGELPWPALVSFAERWPSDKTLNTLSILRACERRAGIHVEIMEHEVFRLTPRRHRVGVVELEQAGEYEAHLGDRSHVLSAWQLTHDTVGLGSDRDRSLERKVHFNSIRYIWSESRREGRLIAVQSVSGGLASLSGQDTNANELDFEPLELLAENSADLGSDEVEDIPVTPAVSRPIEETRAALPAYASIEQSPIVRLRNLQDANWPRRQTQLTHLRVAFAQWQVDDTYRHPIFDICARDPANQLLRTNPWSHKVGMQTYACAEDRRKKLLNEVLRACERFSVQALLLPEYSCRPETADWIQQELKRRNMDTAVWVGTFRLPPYLSSPKPAWSSATRDWSSVLRVVSSDTGIHRQRCKKYPAVAVGEVFNPETGTLEPLWNKQAGEDEFDLRRKVSELICSEAFVFCSAANMENAAKAHYDLARRFGSTTPLNATVDSVVKDIRSLGQEMSFERSYTRRTILFVPAMTKRAVDYVLLGQSNYLAAGISMVFCNAAGPLACGQSCVIGHDGWDSDTSNSHLEMYPGVGPYHGVQPGIFHQWAEERGWLGKEEQAMVVVDIDPTYSMEGKPRPQMLRTPLELVAHLPIIECHSDASDVEADFRHAKSRTKCACSPHRFNDLDGINQTLESILTRLDAVKSQINAHNDLVSSIYDDDPQVLAAALRALERKHDVGGWIAKRTTAYERFHASNPQIWPPPVALDMLLIDHSHRAPAQLSIPPYSQGNSPPFLGTTQHD